MISKIKRVLRSILESLYFIEKQTVCFSQEGEDLILEEFFHENKNGFYIDIGAFHPIRFSNTYLFYLKGWRGINIDARPGSMKRFNKKRKRDTNIEVAISDEESELTYYMFNEPALNGFSKIISENRESVNNYKIINQVKIKTKKLEQVLDQNLPENQNIDFMSIDVEGLDLNVLHSNNWKKYSPTMILVETSVVSDGSGIGSPIDLFLTEKGYKLVAKTYRTSFYKLIQC